MGRAGDAEARDGAARLRVGWVGTRGEACACLLAGRLGGRTATAQLAGRDEVGAVMGCSAVLWWAQEMGKKNEVGAACVSALALEATTALAPGGHPEPAAPVVGEVAHRVTWFLGDGRTLS